MESGLACWFEAIQLRHECEQPRTECDSRERPNRNTCLARRSHSPTARWHAAAVHQIAISSIKNTSAYIHLLIFVSFLRGLGWYVTGFPRPPI